MKIKHFFAGVIFFFPFLSSYDPKDSNMLILSLSDFDTYNKRDINLNEINKEIAEILSFHNRNPTLKFLSKNKVETRNVYASFPKIICTFNIHDINIPSTQEVSNSKSNTIYIECKTGDCIKCISDSSIGSEKNIKDYMDSAGEVVIFTSKKSEIRFLQLINAVKNSN
jgi:hypothetical protein